MSNDTHIHLQCDYSSQVVSVASIGLSFVFSRREITRHLRKHITDFIFITIMLNWKCIIIEQNCSTIHNDLATLWRSTVRKHFILHVHTRASMFSGTAAHSQEFSRGPCFVSGSRCFIISDIISLWPL